MVLLEKLTGLQLIKKFPHFIEPEYSLPHSQVPATCPYPELHRSSPFPHIPLPEDPSQYYPLIYARVFLVVSFPQVCPPKPCTRLSPPHTRYMPRQSHSFWFYHSHNIGWAVQIIKLLIMYFFHSPVTLSLLGPNILLNTLFLYTLSLGAFLNVSDKFSHPYTTRGKNVVLNILNFICLDSKLEDERCFGIAHYKLYSSAAGNWEGYGRRKLVSSLEVTVRYLYYLGLCKFTLWRSHNDEIA